MLFNETEKNEEEYEQHPAAAAMCITSQKQYDIKQSMRYNNTLIDVDISHQDLKKYFL